MANFNLTTQQIKDTYEQLTQVSASLLVDGTGSLSPILTSSIINFPTEVSRSAAAAGFGSGTTLPSGVISSSAQVVYSGITGVPSGILSSSSQIATQISGAFTSTSASLAANIATNTSDITTKLDTSTFTSYSSSVSTRLTTDESNISTNTSNISTQTSRVDSLVAATSSYAVKSSNNTFSGTQTFTNIAVSGTASIAYLEQVTGSAVIIGEEFIILNTALPAARYAGIKVYDTGSTESTASFLFDGLYNDWFYQYSGSDGTDFGVALFGPEYDTIGNPLYPTANQIQKGTGGHHLTGSNITDNGSQVSITGPVSASTYFGDGSNLTGVSSGLVAGTGTNSLRSALTTTPAIAGGVGSISIGNSSFSNSTASIAIGVNSQIGNLADGAINIGSGSISENCNASIAIGKGSNVAGNRSNVIAIGVNASAGAEGVAIGSGASGVLVSGNDGQTVAIGKNSVASTRYSIAIGEASNTAGGVGIVQNTAIGRAAGATGGSATAIGYSSNASGVNSVAIGDSDATSVNAVAVGVGANASNTNTTALGVSANASGDEAVAIGTAFGVNGENALGIGRRGTASGARSIAIGSLTEATAADTIAIGASITATSANQINIGNRFKFDGVASIFLSGSVTGSGGFSGDGSGLTNITALSASYAQTASFAAGNFEVAGQMFSPVFSGSIASSTSSIDFNEGNFAVLTLTGATHIANPSNIKSGTTYTLIMNSGSLASTYGTSFKFAGGTKPTLSNGVDIVTMVSDGSRLFATGLANFS